MGDGRGWGVENEKQKDLERQKTGEKCPQWAAGVIRKGETAGVCWGGMNP